MIGSLPEGDGSLVVQGHQHGREIIDRMDGLRNVDY